MQAGSVVPILNIFSMGKHSIGSAGICLVILFVFSCLPVIAQWPKSIPLPAGGKITIYQPQPESLRGVILSGRAAVSVQKTPKDDLIFGAIFFEATLATDKSMRMATLESIRINYAKFPGVSDTGKINGLARLIQTEVPKWNLETSLELLIASIDLANSDAESDIFKNDPPKLVYRDKPTTLVILDGEPKIQKDKDLDANRVLNTPSLIFQEGNQWNMYSGGVWYRSDSVTKGWTPNKSLSAKVKSINEKIKKQEKEQNNGKEITAKPEVTDILVSTVATELLQTKGVAVYKPIMGTGLLYVSNSVNDIFKKISTKKLYVLIAGRWYSSANLNGAWTHVSTYDLPADFARIPEGSEKDNVLASVPGTYAAEEAIIDAQIPQTAKVDRKTATVTVEYDGEPTFKPVEGTSLQLAENTNITVMKDTAGQFYALNNGVWFRSSTATGPWAVADTRPTEVEKIPASSPAYNTKYVYIYESTPEYVYMGYTPGYMGSYIYGPTVVYGTGYYYAPWYGTMYYPHPVTWGYGFSYNPWTGWGMMSVGVGYNVGNVTIGISVGVSGMYGGWYGPPMYYPPVRVYHGSVYGNRINNDNISIHNRGNNVYNNSKGVSSQNMNRGDRARGSTRPNAQSARANNNVFADRNGNAHRRDNKGSWSMRDNQANRWNANTAASRDMNRDFNNRDRGATRERSFQQGARPSGGMYGSGMYGGGMHGGAMRGGGGRRR
jgi:hypothetical protein